MRNIKRISEKYEINLDTKQISLLFFSILLLLGLSFSIGVMYGRGLKKIEKPEIGPVVEKPPEVLKEHFGSEKSGEVSPSDNYTFYNTLTSETPPPGILQPQEPQKPVVIPQEEAPAPEKHEPGTEEVKESSKEVKTVSEEVKTEKPISEDIKTEKKGEYAVQVVAYNERDRARSMVKKLKSKGFNAFVEEGRTGGKRIFRVKIGYFESRTEAEKMVRELKVKMELNGIITK